MPKARILSRSATTALCLASAALLWSSAAARAQGAPPATPSEAKASPRVAVLAPSISGKAAPGTATRLTNKLQAGLRASGLTVVQTQRAKAKPCGPRCVRRICRKQNTRYVAGARVEADHPFYKLHLWIADGKSGARVAAVNEKCDVCPPVAVASRMELAASRLAVALRERAKKNAVFVITSDPEGAEVYINDKLKGQTPLRLELPPGAYLVEARKEGYYNGKKELRAVSAVEEKVNIVLVPEASEPSKLATIAGWSAIGVGAASIIGGIVMLAMDGKGTDCVNLAGAEVCKKNFDTGVAGWLLIGGGAVAAGGGAALLFWPRGGSKESKSAFSTPNITVSPMANGRRALGMSVGGRF